MKLATAIIILSAVTVQQIKDTLKNSPTTNIINITPAITAGVGDHVLYGCDDTYDSGSLNLAQILSIEDARDVDKEHLRESNISTKNHKNNRTRVALLRQYDTYKKISNPPLNRTKDNNNLIPPTLKEAIPMPPNADMFYQKRFGMFPLYLTSVT